MTSFSQLPPADALTPDDILPIGQRVIDPVTGQARYITRAIHPGSLFGLDFNATSINGVQLGDVLPALLEWFASRPQSSDPVADGIPSGSYYWNGAFFCQAP
jgi:hypothetical protein